MNLHICTLPNMKTLFTSKWKLTLLVNMFKMWRFNACIYDEELILGNYSFTNRTISLNRTRKIFLSYNPQHWAFCGHEKKNENYGHWVGLGHQSPSTNHLPLIKNLQIGRGLIFLSEGSLTSPSSRSSSCEPATTVKLQSFKDQIMSSQPSSWEMIHILIVQNTFIRRWMWFCTKFD